MFLLTLHCSSRNIKRAFYFPPPSVINSHSVICDVGFETELLNVVAYPRCDALRTTHHATHTTNVRPQSFYLLNAF